MPKKDPLEIFRDLQDKAEGRFNYIRLDGGILVIDGIWTNPRLKDLLKLIQLVIKHKLVDEEKCS